jgi:hypothetical protein
VQHKERSLYLNHTTFNYIYVPQTTVSSPSSDEDENYYHNTSNNDEFSDSNEEQAKRTGNKGDDWNNLFQEFVAMPDSLEKFKKYCRD